MKNEKQCVTSIKISVDTSEIDVAQEKVDKLIRSLKEANKLVYENQQVLKLKWFVYFLKFFF